MAIGKKIVALLLIGLLMAAVSAPAVAAEDGRVGLVFNGQEYQADLYVENGVTYISAASLAKIPGLDLEEEDFIPLRNFFESRGGIVHWNKRSGTVSVSWREKNDGWSADDLVMETNRQLQVKNTYKMKGSAIIEMDVAGLDEELPDMPQMTSVMEGSFQQEPLAIYIKQSMNLPLDLSGQDLSAEELALLGGEMITEMLWTENNIYQKTPLADQWIVQDLFDMDMMENLTSMMQTSPQQSLEMMRKFGIISVYGDDAEIDGQQYYTISNYIDSVTFKKVMTEFMADFDFGGLLSGLEDIELDEEEAADFQNKFAQVLEQLLTTMEVNYYVDTYVNKETLLTEYMKFNMEMQYELDETINPEGAVSFKMFMSGDFELYDFGEEIELPDVSDAITQQELMKQMMEMMEIPEE